MTDKKPKKAKKPTHPWRVFAPGQLREKPRQIPNNEVMKP